MVEGIAARASTNIEQDANIGVECPAKGVEEPSVRVELAAVLFLEAENHLAGNNALLGTLELEVRVKRYLSGVLINVSLDGTVVDKVLGDTVLENTHSSKGVKCTRVDLGSAITNDADHNLLPASLTPSSGTRTGAKMRNILHDSVHGTRKADFVFVVHGNADEELCLARGSANGLSEFVPSLDKVIGVASDCGISHMCKLNLITAREETVQNCGNFALEHQLTVDEHDFLSRHLRRAYTSSLLCTIRRGPIAIHLFVILLFCFIFIERFLRLGVERVASCWERARIAEVRAGAKDIVATVKRNVYCGIIGKSL